jgi:hypothetical protein
LPRLAEEALLVQAADGIMPTQHRVHHDGLLDELHGRVLGKGRSVASLVKDAVRRFWRSPWDGWPLVFEPSRSNFTGHHAWPDRSAATLTRFEGGDLFGTTSWYTKTTSKTCTGGSLLSSVQEQRTILSCRLSSSMISVTVVDACSCSGC